MKVIKSESVPIIIEQDIVRARQLTRQWSIDYGFKLVDQTKLVTAVSELARNTLIYGKGGVMLLEAVEKNLNRGIRVVFEDRGPGIANIEQALQDGFTSGRGMGLGLPGAKRLSNDFEIQSTVGEGTRVMIARWV